MQNLYRAVVSMPSDGDARPIGGNTIPLTIEYGGHTWAVNVPLSEFAEAHREASGVADTDGVE